MKTLSAAWASSWVDGIDQFPQGRQCGFSYGYREENITRHCCTFSCKTGNRPSGAGKPLQQPANVTPPHHILHNQTDSAADHTLTPLHSRSHQLPVTLLSAAIRLTRLAYSHRFRKKLRHKMQSKLQKYLSQPNLNSYLH